EIEPRLFSFNNPFGACPTCDGLGVQLKFDQELVVPDSSKTLNDGVIAPWAKGASPLYTQTLQALARHAEVALTTPWTKLPESFQKLVLYGSGTEKVKFVYDDGARRY
ncbi:MAG: excinuclease ABC subunit A, partial [bacterium]